MKKIYTYFPKYIDVCSNAKVLSKLASLPVGVSTDKKRKKRKKKVICV